MRVAIVCPGRGSYARGELGSLARAHAGEPAGLRADLIQRADVWRQRIGRTLVSELDGAKSFSSRHLAGENAAALIYTGAAIDLGCLHAEHEVVAVCGNSMGWYIALHAAGCLDFDAGLRLVDTMGGQQLHGVSGGQLIWPLVDEQWRPDAALRSQLDAAYAAVHAAGHGAWPSIDLGGFAVVGADDEGMKILERSLPAMDWGRGRYPLRLLGHSAFHTPLLRTTAERGRRELADLELAAPRVPLIDGRGQVFRPWTSTAVELFDYTLGAQVVTPYDFTRSVRVVLREYAPDALVLLGPGDSLGGALGQILVQEGWRGIGDKTAFLNAQTSDAPPVLAMGRAEQRDWIIQAR